MRALDDCASIEAGGIGLCPGDGRHSKRCLGRFDSYTARILPKLPVLAPLLLNEGNGWIHAERHGCVGFD